MLNREFSVVRLGGHGRWLTFGSAIRSHVMVVFSRPGLVFSLCQIDHEEMMKFDTWVNKEWCRDGIENEKIDGGWSNLIGFNLSSTLGVWRNER